MNKQSGIRRERLLSEAEGYLLLEMPDHALTSLNEIEEPEEVLFHVCYLRGLAYRSRKQHAQALESLQRAYALQPEHVDLLIAMAWCFKRTDQLPQAIEMMEQAYRVKPKEAVVLYNLACYWCLAGNKTQALSWLGRAIRMDKSLRQLVPDEHDFDSLRHDPDFQLIVSAPDEVAS